MAPEIPLKHLVLAIFAAAAARGRERVPLADVFAIFAVVVDAHPALFPLLAFGRSPCGAYSKHLDQALQASIGLCVDVEIVGRRPPCLLIGAGSARRIVARLRGAYGETAIDRLGPAVDSFLKAADDAED